MDSDACRTADRVEIHTFDRSESGGNGGYFSGARVGPAISDDGMQR
jgi:hypothetical protein